MCKNNIFERTIRNRSDLLDFYRDAVLYRNEHKNQSTEIALRVFDKTIQLDFAALTLGEKLNKLRDEFGGLEAPGAPEDDNESVDEYDDRLWSRLFDMITEEKRIA